MFLKILKKSVLPIIAALILMAALISIPLLVAASAVFLGKDVTNLATTIVSFYPWYFIRELLKVAALVFSLFFAVSLLFFHIRQGLKRSEFVKFIVFPIFPILTVILFCFGSLYDYPALYDSILNLKIQRIIFETSHYVGPLFFRFCALGLIIGGLGVVFVKNARSRIPIASAIVGLVLLVGVESFAPTPLASVQSEKPNVLIVAIDSLRTDSITDDVMPETFRIAQDNSTVSFENHYIGVPRTFPSWVELLYARNAPSTSVRHMFPGFGDRRQLTEPLAKVFSDNGYTTAIVSDFAGDIFPRFESGFERVDAPSMNIRALIELSVHQKFLLFLPFTTLNAFSSWFPALTQNPAFADPSRLAKKFEKIRSATGSKPWFTTIFFSTAHFPYAAPYPYFKDFSDKNYEGPFFFQKNPEITGEESLALQNIEQTRSLYKGALKSIDDSIGLIVDELKKSGEWEQTIIVVTADHGEDLYEFGRLQGHGEHLFGRNVIKVPLLIRVPGQDFSNKSPVNFVSRSVDVGPTIVGRLGFNWHGVHGVNLFPFVDSGGSSDPGLVAYSETGIWFSATGKGDFQKKRLAYLGISGLLSFDHGMSQEIVLNPEYERLIATAKHRSVVRGIYKLVYMPTEDGVEFSLFNEKDDPDNLNDLASSEAQILGDMKAVFYETVLRLEPKYAKIGDYIVKK
jgi:arylsulfatase A-like enzyme